MLLWRVFLADLAGQFYLTWCCPLQLAAISNAISILWRYLSGERFLAASLVMGCCLSTLLQSERKIYGSCVKGFYWNHSINSWNLQKLRMWCYTVYPSQNPASSHHTQCVYVPPEVLLLWLVLIRTLEILTVAINPAQGHGNIMLICKLTKKPFEDFELRRWSF